MICEKCEIELPNSVGGCPGCGYNPVLQRMDDWREKRTQKLSSYNQGTTVQSEDKRPTVRGPRANAKDATLIRFPQRAVTPPPPPLPAAAAEPVPAWKERLNSRLQEIRAQREPSAPAVSVQANFDRNPIILNALNRIHRANYLQPVTPLPHSRSATAAELAPTPIEEEPLPASVYLQIATTPRATIISRIPTAVLQQAPVHSLSEVGTPAAEEDLLSEINLELPAVPAIPQTRVETEPTTATHSTLEAATLPKRVAAAVIDAEIIASSLLPLFGAYFFLSGWFEAPTFYIPILIAVLLITAYYFVTYSLAGRTMGMAWCNLHLANLSTASEPLAPTTTTFTIRQAIMRALGGTISLVLFPLNILCIARSDERLSISDYLSETQVVRIRK